MTNIKAKCWANNRWVQFNLKPGIYTNVIVFLNEMKLSFLTTIPIDFTNIPIDLHGKGVSGNLINYLSNNDGNNILILNFLIYFLNEIIDVRYKNDDKIIFSFIEGPQWQGLQLIIEGEPIIWITLDSTYYSCDDYNLTCDMTKI